MVVRELVEQAFAFVVPNGKKSGAGRKIHAPHVVEWRL